MVFSKILIVTSEFPPEPGGIGNHAFNLAKQLQQNNFQVSVLADQRLNDSTEVEFDKELEFKVTRTRLKKFRLKMYINRVYQIFKLTSKSDTIIASGKFSLWLVALTSFFFNKKYIAVIHGTEVNFKKKIINKSIEFSLKKFHKVIAVSNYTKSLIKKNNIKNIEVIFNGFEIDNLPQNISKNKLKGFPNLITVGSLSQRKGQHNVINALPYIIKNYPNVHYHIVGKPNEEGKLLNIAKKLNVDKHITIYGAVAEEKKIDLLQNSDIFIMLSENTLNGDVEGFGIAILEANYFLKPAIGSKNCGIEDAISNKKSGILVEKSNALEILNAINLILKEYSQFEKEAKKWSLNFTWTNVIKKYIKIINF